jgi:hypothetical protein
MNSRRPANPTRREHIVPRMLLANFTDSDGVLWVYSKGKPVRDGNPARECWERDFYEYELNGRKTNNRYENWLANVEGEAARILPAVSRREMLDLQDSIKWSTFVASLFYRTRKVRMQISNAMLPKFREQVQNPDYIRDMQCELLQRGELRYFDDLKKEAEELLAQMEESPSFYHLSALRRQSASIAQTLLTRKWDVVDAPQGTHFLISDCPVTTLEMNGHLGTPGSGFNKKRTVVLLPITSQKLFVASPHNIDWHTEAKSKAVESVNSLIVGFAHNNVYANINSGEIQSLVDREINRVEFGKTAFVPSSESQSSQREARN